MGYLMRLCITSEYQVSQSVPSPLLCLNLFRAVATHLSWVDGSIFPIFGPHSMKVIQLKIRRNKFNENSVKTPLISRRGCQARFVSNSVCPCTIARQVYTHITHRVLNGSGVVWCLISDAQLTVPATLCIDGASNIIYRRNFQSR